MNIQDKGNGVAVEGASVFSGVELNEGAAAEGHYVVECVGPREEVRELYCKMRDELTVLQSSLKRFIPGMARRVKELKESMASMLEPKWNDCIENVVCTEGKNAAFQSIFKASAFTSVVYMGLIGNVTYSAPAAGNTAAAIATSASANSWNEAAAATSAARAAPSFATPSAGAVSLSAARTFSMLAADTINGCFVLIPSVALVNPTSAVANTSGALWSAGAFTGGAKTVANGDTLNVSYTASM